MRLVQWQTGFVRGVSLISDGGALCLKGVSSAYELAMRAIEEGVGIVELAESLVQGDIDYEALAERGLLIAPLDHPEPHRMLVSGTGLTHLGSAATRDEMHVVVDDKKTDSMRMFDLGVESGKPGPGQVGAEPEWFYKGDGSCVVAPGKPLPMPAYAKDGGEEPELVGLYVIDNDGVPRRLGFALGNEFSDHVLEKTNYLYLAHSKLRACSFGPELLLGDLPENIQGNSRIVRNGKTVWEKGFASGEQNMCHHIANLEHHHFKYPMFHRTGDVHAHFFGTATLSFADGFKTEDGDVFEIECADFGKKLSNPLRHEADEGFVKVMPL